MTIMVIIMVIMMVIMMMIMMIIMMIIIIKKKDYNCHHFKIFCEIKIFYCFDYHDDDHDDDDGDDPRQLDGGIRMFIVPQLWVT